MKAQLQAIISKIFSFFAVSKEDVKEEVRKQYEICSKEICSIKEDIRRIEAKLDKLIFAILKE